MDSLCRYFVTISQATALSYKLFVHIKWRANGKGWTLNNYWVNPEAQILVSLTISTHGAHSSWRATWNEERCQMEMDFWGAKKVWFDWLEMRCLGPNVAGAAHEEVNSCYIRTRMVQIFKRTKHREPSGQSTLADGSYVRVHVQSTSAVTVAAREQFTMRAQARSSVCQRRICCPRLPFISSQCCFSSAPLGSAPTHARRTQHLHMHIHGLMLRLQRPTEGNRKVTHPTRTNRLEPSSSSAPTPKQRRMKKIRSLEIFMFE